MRIAITLMAVTWSAASMASDVTLACNFNDGLHSNLSILNSNGKQTFREGSLVIVDGEKDAFGGAGRISQTPAMFRIEYTLGSLKIVTTVWTDSWQLLELTNRDGAETYRSGQCAPTGP